MNSGNFTLKIHVSGMYTMVNTAHKIVSHLYMDVAVCKLQGRPWHELHIEPAPEGAHPFLWERK